MKITRSFTRKINLNNYGGPSYETADFYCEVTDDVTNDELATKSLELHEVCRKEVTKSANEYIKIMKKSN